MKTIKLSQRQLRQLVTEVGRIASPEREIQALTSQLAKAMLEELKAQGGFDEDPQSRTYSSDDQSKILEAVAVDLRIGLQQAVKQLIDKAISDVTGGRYDS